MCIRDSVRDDARKIAESENLSFAETENHIYKSEQGYLDDNMCEVFAIIKDASRRIVGTKYKVMDQDIEWNMVHYDVQII